MLDMRRAMPFIIAATTGKVSNIISLLFLLPTQNSFLRCPLWDLCLQTVVCTWSTRSVCAQAFDTILKILTYDYIGRLFPAKMSITKNLLPMARKQSDIKVPVSAEYIFFAP